MVRNEYGDPLRSIYLTNDIVKVCPPHSIHLSTFKSSNPSNPPRAPNPSILHISQLLLELTAAAQRIIQNNDYTRLRIISAGVKALTRQDSQARTDIGCKWRIPSEGVLELIPHIGAGVVKEVGIRELKVLLEEQYPPVCLGSLFTCTT